MHLDRALRDQPEHLFSALRSIQRLLEEEKFQENVGRLRLALGRGQAALEKRAQERRDVLAQLRQQPNAILLARADQMMRDLDVTAEERETVRAARVRLREEQEAAQRELDRKRMLREARREQEQRARTERERAEQRERAEKLSYLAPFLLGALKKAAREKRATTLHEIQDKTGQRELGCLTNQDRLAILEIVEKETPSDRPLWSTVLAATGSEDALRLHRELLQRLNRPTADDDAGLLAEIHTQCVQLSRQW
ncbi:hypothetical protein [Streptomyces sp. NPDC060366]|uniref:hypothetical protein n=1 Tax=Streptomyces sp. NPDC060366 TaxID=3347105 RepID=UPI00366837F6